MEVVSSIAHRLLRPIHFYTYIYFRAYGGDYYKTGIGLTTGFIGSHTVTRNYSVYTLTAPYSSLQHLPSLHTVSSLVAFLPISQDPFACNSSRKTAARPEYSLVTANLRLNWQQQQQQ
jgi:hypothetical protein